MQNVQMKLFHLLAIYFAQSVFFSFLTLTSLGFFGYILSKEGVASVLLLILL